MISGPNPAADFGCVLVFFRRGSPRFPGGPLDLPWGASGRLGGDFPADGPPSSQPAWENPPAKKFRRLRRALVFFPNETSFWETPLRIKEKASDRWEN